MIPSHLKSRGDFTETGRMQEAPSKSQIKTKVSCKPKLKQQTPCCACAPFDSSLRVCFKGILVLTSALWKAANSSVSIIFIHGIALVRK